MKRLVILFAIVVIVVGLLLFELSDKVISTLRAGVPNIEVPSAATKVERSSSNSSASAGITITMYAVADE